jgi:hypothetical protein
MELASGELYEAPRVDLFSFHDPPHEAKGTGVEFRLIYQGSLPSQSGGNRRVKEKHAIRKVFHGQLKELWARHTVLRRMPPVDLDPNTNEEVRHYNRLVTHKIANASGHIYEFLPLIGDEYGVSCSLDILFLRRDAPGGLVSHGGDIDNRLKVLFDSLRIPLEVVEMPDSPAAEDEQPFYCLMEDDKFVDQMSVTTDRLLVPRGPGENIHDVTLVIRVKTIVFDVTKTPSGIFH